MKSKMNVKSLELPENCILHDEIGPGVHETEYGSKGGYGTLPRVKTVVDVDNKTVKYVEQPQPAFTGHCGWFNR